LIRGGEIGTWKSRGGFTQARKSGLTTELAKNWGGKEKDIPFLRGGGKKKKGYRGKH